MLSEVAGDLGDILYVVSGCVLMLMLPWTNLELLSVPFAT